MPCQRSRSGHASFHSFAVSSSFALPNSIPIAPLLNSLALSPIINSISPTPPCKVSIYALRSSTLASSSPSLLETPLPAFKVFLIAPTMVSVAAASASTSPSTAGAASASPCAACKFLRRKCQPECVFAPYFPPDQPQKFVHVHRVFGASNVTKLLNEVHPFQREDAVNSLAYEADMRLRDPVYGCVGVISLLQHQLRQLQLDLSRARAELSRYQYSPPAHGSFIDINLPMPGGAAVTGFGLDHFFPEPAAAPLRSYDADHDLVAAKLAHGAGANVVPLGLAAGDERPAVAPLLRFGEWQLIAEENEL